MKERIRQLKLQASLWCDANIPEQFSEETMGYGTAWEDKFAELIVQECANVNYNSPFQDGEFHARELLEHFGVKS